jgi:hypothetical protein
MAVIKTFFFQIIVRSSLFFFLKDLEDPYYNQIYV